MVKSDHRVFKRNQLFRKPNVPIACEPIADRWNFSAPVHLRLRPSWRLAVALLVAHTGAVVCLLTTALPARLTWLAVLVVAWHLFHALGQHAFRCTPTAITELILVNKTEVRLVTNGQGPIDAVLLGGYSQPILKVLHLRLGPWRRRSVVLLSDMMEADRWRELRVRLRRLGPALHSDIP